MSRSPAAGFTRSLGVAALAAVVGIASYLLGVRSALGQVAEARVLGEAEFTTAPPPPLNLVSIPGVILAFAVVGVVALVAHGVWRAVSILVVSAAGVIASQLLKLQFLDRPELFELDAPNTFPSGHMTVFVLLVAALIWAVPARVRALTAIAGAVLLSVVSWQLLEYGWHRPSDVLGAMALGVLLFAILSLVGPPASTGRSRLVALDAPVQLVLIGSGVALIIAALVALLMAVRSDAAGHMLLAGELGVIGASAISAQALQMLRS